MRRPTPVLRPAPAGTVVGGLGNCEVFEARNVLKDVVTSGVQRSMRYLKVLFSSMDAGRGRSAATRDAGVRASYALALAGMARAHHRSRTRRHGDDRLVGDAELLLRDGTMPGRLWQVFHHYKRDEWERYLAAVTDWERDEYLEVLP